MARCGVKVFYRSIRLNFLKNIAEQYLEQNQSQTLDWDSLRERVKTNGMRNSNVLAIAPTATIANICGVISIDRADLSKSFCEIEFIR